MMAKQTCSGKYTPSSENTNHGNIFLCGNRFVIGHFDRIGAQKEYRYQCWSCVQ
jgi:hypothetical protein